MPLLKITVFGLSGLDSRELEEVLSGLDDVHEVVTHNSADDLEPGVIYASALHVTYVISFLVSAGGTVFANLAGGATKEMGKDLYLAAKERVQRRVADWKDEKNAETPERIHLVMSDDGELFISRFRR